jgi:hypothetical protein
MSGSPPHWLALRRMSLGVEGNEIYVFWFFLLLRSGLGYRVRGFLRTDLTGILGILVSRTLLLQKLLTESLGDIPLGSYPLGCSTVGFLSWCRSYDYTQPPVGIVVSIIIFPVA